MKYSALFCGLALAYPLVAADFDLTSQGSVLQQSDSSSSC